MPFPEIYIEGYDIERDREVGKSEGGGGGGNGKERAVKETKEREGMG